MYSEHKLLVANRGEIAVRIIRTAKELGIWTISIYVPTDALSPHVILADEAVALTTSDLPAESGSQPYINGPSILAIAKAHSATLLHPGYGFLSENSEFASLVENAGITWLGPRPSVIRMMGIKHEARKMAVDAGLPVVPGSSLLVVTQDALDVAKKVGFPVILKATAGGGGMGMSICANETELCERFKPTSDRAKILFGNCGLFLERYLPAGRHVEIQVFGNGRGDVVHMNERECSVQRRHQKMIEESPSPFLESHPGLREKMCKAAIKLCQSIMYGSAGTVEFLVDHNTAEFYFLEMNTRIQVEHPVTEAIYPGLDLVKLMIQHGVAERRREGLAKGKVEEVDMQQSTYDALRTAGHATHAWAIEGRVYAEDPSENFMPCPGLLQYVDLNSRRYDWLRVESYVSTGVSITPFSDALLVKLVVTGRSRQEAMARFGYALDGCKIFGPPNGLEYLKAILNNDVFRSGAAATTFLNDFPFTPCALKVISPGIDCSVQEYPGRTIGLGIPRSGPMDSLAFRAGNILVGNSLTTEGLEIVILPGVGFALEFFVPTVIAVTGREVSVKVDNKLADTWSRILVPSGGKLRLAVDPKNPASSTGFRVYLCVRGGFPNVPSYLGSKSTSMGLGGYQGRSLLPGDQLALGECGPKTEETPFSLPRSWVPKYPSEWIVYVLSGPHDTEEFVTAEGIKRFYASKFRVSSASNRMGIRLEAPEKVEWTRTSGGEGGSHPSNILDNAYAHATVNINGDTPVILTHEGPDMGGYVCLCTIASAETWKLGQINPGSTIEFRRVSWNEAVRLNDAPNKWLEEIKDLVAHPGPRAIDYIDHSPYSIGLEDTPQSPLLHAEGQGKNQVVFRQAGDSSILVEFGQMHLDLASRARIHAIELVIKQKNTPGLRLLRPCTRSTMCDYDFNVISQAEILEILIAAQKAVPDDVTGMTFPARRVTFPVVLDDRWNREALERYMSTTRKKAVYLPSNIDYLARNNGLSSGTEMLEKMVASDWIVIGVGFYLACAFMVPIDPRCRLVGQKMNPSRTFTPRGAMGIGGPISVVYPVESPGGYQLYGRALPTWQTWGKGKDFALERPWILLPFDQVHLEPITQEEYLKLEQQFDAGQYEFKVEPTTLSMRDYTKFVESIQDEVAGFLKGQAAGMAQEEQREREYLQEWEEEKRANTANPSAATGLIDYSLPNSATLTASLFASVWKIKSQAGDVIQSEDEILVILEAMKTEIPVRAGEDNVGKTIKQIAVKEGAMVRPGDIVAILD